MPSSGIALAAVPAPTRPQTRLRLDLGSTLRDSAAGSSVMILPRAKTRSAVRCGRAVCPPGPVTRTEILSQAAVIAPTRVPILPTSSRGSQCRAKTRSTEAMPPAASTSSAPHGTSSAGWKISLTRPGSAPAAAVRARNRPVPSSTVVCTSCPQAWQALGNVLLVAERQRVQVSAQAYHRLGRDLGGRSRQASPVEVGPDVDEQAGALGQNPGPQAGSLEPELDTARRPVLVVTDLRVGMQVAPEVDEFGLVPGEKRVELALKVMFGHTPPPPVSRNDPPRTR